MTITPDPDVDSPDLPPGEAASTPRAVSVTIDTAALEEWLAETDSLPESAAAAIAEALCPADDARDGALAAGRSGIDGRGLFVTSAFTTGAVITVCPLLRIPGPHMDAFADTTVYGHCFELDDDLFGYPMGLATLLNHSPSPNARCELDGDAAELWVYAAVDVAAGSEITIDYTGGDADHELWFELES